MSRVKHLPSSLRDHALEFQLRIAVAVAIVNVDGALRRVSVIPPDHKWLNSRGSASHQHCAKSQNGSPRQ